MMRFQLTWIDNVFMERLWRTVKYENVYLHAYRDGRDTQQRFAAYFLSTTRDAFGVRLRCVKTGVRKSEILSHLCC